MAKNSTRWFDMLWKDDMPRNKNINAQTMARGRNYQYQATELSHLMNLWVNMIIWEGLADTVDWRFIERMEMLNAMALYADYKSVHIALAAGIGGGLSVNGRPTQAWGWGYDGTNEQFRAYVPYLDKSPYKFRAADGTYPEGTPNAVIIYDNPDHYPAIIALNEAARRIADLRRSEDTAVKAMKSPVILTVPKEQEKGALEMVQAIDDNVLAIIKTDEMAENQIKALQTGANPAIVTAISDSADREESRILARIGISSNRNEDKKERMTTSEVTSLSQLIAANIDVRIRERKLACEYIADCFGVEKPTVRINEEVMKDVERLSDAAGVLRGTPAGGAVQSDGSAG